MPFPQERLTTLTPRPAGQFLPTPEYRRPEKRKPSARLSTACIPCKRRKSKCSGGPSPCLACQRTGSTCVIDETLDQRRKVAARRTSELAQAQQQYLQNLLCSLKYSDQDDLHNLIIKIRQGTSAAEITGQLDKNVNVLVSQRKIPGSGADGSVEDILAHLESHALDGSHAQSGMDSPSETASPQIYGSPNMLDRTLASVNSNAYVEIENDRTYQSYHVQPDGDKPEYISAADTVGTPNSRNQFLPLLHHESSVSSFDFSDSNQRGGWNGALQVKGQQGPNANDLFPLRRRLTFWDSARLSDSPGHIEALGTPLDWLMDLKKADDPTAFRQSDVHRFQIPMYALNTLVTWENSPMSRVFSSFRQTAQQLIDETDIDIVGGFDVDVDLFFRDRIPESDGYTVAECASEVCKSFLTQGWDHTLCLGLTMFLTRMWQWQLQPTKDRYGCLPDIIKPLPIQLFVRHHVTIDFLPIPSLREALIQSLRDYITYLPRANFSCNWPYPGDQAYTVGDDTGRRKLTHSFMQHVSELGNWSIGESILGTFPELEGNIRLQQGY